MEHFVDRGFESYGQYWAEGAKLPGIKPERVFARFRIGEGLEYLYDAKAQGLGTIIALPHIGSWEWGGSFLDSLGLGMTAVAEDLEPPALFAWFKEKRESIGIRIEPLDEHAGTVLLQTLERTAASSACSVTATSRATASRSSSLASGSVCRAVRPRWRCAPAPRWWRRRVTRDPVAITSPSSRRRFAPNGSVDCAKTSPGSPRRWREELEGLIRRAPEQWHVLQPRFEGN